MKTSRILRLAQTWFLAAILAAAALTTVPSAADARQAVQPGESVSSAVVLPASWYDDILNSRAKTIQAVFVIVIIGAFMLRRSS